MKNLLSIEQLTGDEIRDLLALGHKLKAERGHHEHRPLKGQTWALICAKSSTRTHGAAIRTYGQQEVEEFASFSGIPTINALTDEEHPCQILADLLTIEELYGPGSWKDMKIAFVGDGDNNMSRSWMWAAKRLGFTLAIGAPTNYLPLEDFRRHLDCDNVIFTTNPVEAVRDASVINTDVWLSMGQEAEGQSKEKHFYPYQVNEELLAHAAPGHSVFHCLPAYRGKEITEDVLERFAPVIFQEAENRVHAQKAVLATLAEASKA